MKKTYCTEKNAPVHLALLGINKIKMSNQGNQTWLRSPISSQDSQTWLRSLISSQGIIYVGRGGQNPSIEKGQTTNYKMTNNDQHKSS